jgi:uncharacterized protein YjbI with pentapeptide repeats
MPKTRVQVLTPLEKRGQLAGARLTSQRFSGVDLSDTVFARSDCGDGVFIDVDLRRADFRQSLLTNALFLGCDCTGAEFAGASLARARFVACSGLDAQMVRLLREGGAELIRDACPPAVTSRRDAAAPRGRDGRGGPRVEEPCDAAPTRGRALAWNRVIADLRRNKNAAGTDLRFLHFSFWDLSDTDFRNANLEGANLSQADLSRADLRGANLRGAKLLGAKLRGAVLDGATLSGALVRGADFSGVRGLTAEEKAALGREGAKI